MKRSEALLILDDILDKSRGHLIEEINVDWLLSELEEAGMRMTSVESLCDDVDLRVITYWEPEDE